MVMKIKFLKTSALLFFLFGFSFNCFAQYTPGGLYSLARIGDNSEIEKIFSSQDVSQSRKDNALVAAIVSEKIDTIKLLVSRGADINQKDNFGTSLLINSIMKKYIGSVNCLLDLSVDTNVKGYKFEKSDFVIEWIWTPIMAASYVGDEQLVKRLVDVGSDLSFKGYSESIDKLETAADIAAYSGNLKILKYLIKKNVSIDPEIAFKVVRAGHLDVLKYLLKKYDDINKLSEDLGRTLLIEASIWGQTEVAEFLIKKGADLNILSRSGFTALGEVLRNDFLSFEKRRSIAELLINNKIDVDLRADFNPTNMILATQLGDKKIINMLLSDAL